MSARVPRPAARYRPGKAPKNAQPESDSDDEYVQETPQSQAQILPSRAGTAVTTAGITIQQGSGAIQMPGAAPDIDLDEYGACLLTETDESDDEAHVAQAPQPKAPAAAAPASAAPRPNMAPAAMAPAGSAPLRRQDPAPSAPARLPPSMTLAEPESDESSEYESSSEEEAAPAPLLKPVFVPRSQRTTHGREEAEKARQAEAAAAKAAAEERKKSSHNLAAERVRQEIRENQKEKENIDIDDTDGIDPEGEFTAWRVRELGRIKRVQDAEAAAAAEREEVERRRAMPEEQRLAEDMAYAAETRARKPRGHQGFMQKYYHRGAFFQDMDILQRDFTEQSADAVDKTMLPRIMHVRDFGKRSRSKWTYVPADPDILPRRIRQKTTCVRVARGTGKSRIHYVRDERSSVVASQSRPSVSPRPVSAEQPKICQVRSRSATRLSASVSSAALIAPRTSCLFAQTSTGARAMCSSTATRWSSARASPTRSRSLLSTTKISCQQRRTASAETRYCAQLARNAVWPPASHNRNFRFLYSNTSVLEPIVGAVATTAPRVILYMSVVLPALSSLVSRDEP